MQDYPFHPLCEQYDLWPQDTLEEAVADLKKNGFDPKHPVYTYEGKIVIGRNRFIACQRAEVEPVVRELKLRKGETLEEVISRDNDIRRHDPVEQQKRRRKERVQRVAAARTEGQSLRTIAETEGVSVATVQNDLATSTVQGGCTVEPTSGKVTGQDGRTRTSKPQEKPVCETCRRKGIRFDCPDCKALGGGKRHQKNGTAPKPKNGREKFDWKGADTAFGPVVRNLDKLANAYPDRKKEVEKMRKLLSECYALFTEAKKEVTGGKKSHA